MRPHDRYLMDLEKPDFRADPAQALAIKKLDNLFDRLLAQQDLSLKDKGLSLVNRLLGRSPSILPERGLYFWGGVGRGKTYLMDMFFDALPIDQKLRIHFHRFMRRVHQELATLADTKNPLEIVADRIAAEAKVICFDEFFVSDITDAMILAGMFDALFKRGVCLVATSNIAPDGLYRDGLQRTRFLPAIGLIKQHTEVLNIDGGVDYRLRALERAELYYTPLDGGADASLLQSFERLIPQRDSECVSHRIDTSIEVEGRRINARYLADDVVWFDFDAICDGPRSQNDYIEIAKEFHAVLISDVPQMGPHNEDRARRFINLVDEFYDRNIKLVLSAAVNLQDLYQEGRLAFEFQRTCSRLQEMQSHEYLASAHKA
ncbi:MAG: cell division protein ZapE [Pseudomonadales bacterium]